MRGQRLPDDDNNENDEYNVCDHYDDDDNDNEIDRELMDVNRRNERPKTT